MKYKVRASMPIIKEMARYEGAKIVESTPVSDTVPEFIEKANDPALLASYLKYDAVLKSDYCVVDRWRSFGVIPERI